MTNSKRLKTNMTANGPWEPAILEDFVQYEGVRFSVNWRPGHGFDRQRAPRGSGLYSQIYWPDRAVRIGQSSNIYSRVREAMAWAKNMQEGTARESQLRRTSPICERVKATGNAGFEFYTISADPRLKGRELRMECEAFLFGWFEATKEAGHWESWNLERIRFDLKPIYEDAFRSYQNGAP